MELTVTLLIKFALDLQIILALFFILADKIKPVQKKANFNLITNLFQKSQYYVSFLFTKPSLRFCL